MHSMGDFYIHFCPSDFEKKGYKGLTHPQRVLISSCDTSDGEKTQLILVQVGIWVR